MKPSSLVSIALLTLACHRESARPGNKASAVTASAPSAASPEPSTRASTVLLRLPISAYHPKLVTADDAIYLLTEHAAYRLTPGKEPQTFSLELGVGPALTRTSFVFWSKGAVYRAPKTGGEPERVAALEQQPQYFATSGDAIGWLEHPPDGPYAVRVLDGKKPKTLHSAAQIDALAMVQDWAFFVEVSGDSWRVGAAHEPGKVAYTPAKSGRPPAMLVPSAEELYYYDGARSELVKLSPDLHSEVPWVTGVICSPFSVAEAGEAYCGSVEGLYSVSPQNPKPHMLVPNGQSLVTAISASRTRVAWLRDTGADQLAVEMLEL